MFLIKGGNKPKSYRAKTKHEAEPIICPKCGGSEFIEIINNPMRKGLKWLRRSGDKSLYCYGCKIKVQD